MMRDLQTQKLANTDSLKEGKVESSEKLAIITARTSGVGNGSIG
jgi:hypothetical protein